MRFRFLSLLPKFAVLSFTMSGCFWTGYKLTDETKKGEPIKRNEVIELRNGTVSVSFGKDYRHANALYAVYLSFTNVDSKSDSLEIIKITAGIEDLDHLNRSYSLSNVYWDKFVKSGVGDRVVLIDSVVKNPVPFSPSNSISIGTYDDYDHYTYAYTFRSGLKRKRLRNVKVNVTINYALNGKSGTAVRSFLFERFHYFLWN